MTRMWLRRLSLVVDHNSFLFFRLLLLTLVLSNAVEEVLTTARVFYMLDTNVSLGQDAALDTFVGDNADGKLCHIVLDTCTIYDLCGIPFCSAPFPMM